MIHNDSSISYLSELGLEWLTARVGNLISQRSQFSSQPAIAEDFHLQLIIYQGINLSALWGPQSISEHIG
ncbi:uncharacterized protein An08g11270 [Aspergillus niger]|uniref:Contig An08c0280, genomic contig n=2 Tax=Aspergillus niger TaxID=5061 RepID=A2QSM6_ASPNC|nr:uncharacterized protein An08g11270 [Aspergillus niger]CAK45798.1 unnamed protein product [Aspergillus niger]